jgi:hypothetical protein
MMNIRLIVACAITGGLVAACGDSSMWTIGSYSFGHIKCTSPVGFDGRSYKGSGIEIPVPQQIVPGGTAKVGSIDVSPQTLQQASEKIQALSIGAYETCQALIATSDKNRRDQLAAAMASNVGKYQLAMADLSVAATGATASPAAFANAAAAIPAPEVVPPPSP